MGALMEAARISVLSISSQLQVPALPVPALIARLGWRKSLF